MATAVEVLTLEQARRELSIPASVHDDDVLLLQNINASVSWAFEQTGHDLAVDGCGNGSGRVSGRLCSANATALRRSEFLARIGRSLGDVAAISKH